MSKNRHMNTKALIDNQAGFIPELNTFGNRLRAAREHVGMNQNDLASHAQVSRTTIIGAERGHTIPQRGTIALLALATGVNFHWLLTGEDNRKSPSPDGEGLALLPQLDLNQQPFDYTKDQVSTPRIIPLYPIKHLKAA